VLEPGARRVHAVVGCDVVGVELHGPILVHVGWGPRRTATGHHAAVTTGSLDA
jgi:hypothetical protein